jgi:hypothetical protein
LERHYRIYKRFVTGIRQTAGGEYLLRSRAHAANDCIFKKDHLHEMSLYEVPSRTIKGSMNCAWLFRHLFLQDHHGEPVSQSKLCTTHRVYDAPYISKTCIYSAISSSQCTYSHPQFRQFWPTCTNAATSIFSDYTAFYVLTTTAQAYSVP